MARISYVDFAAYFTDEAEYQLALAISEGKGMIYASPFEISGIFGMPWPPPGGAITEGSHGLIGYPPFTLGVPPVQISAPNPSGIFMDGTVPQVIVPAQAGNPASVFPASAEPTTFRWCCTLQFMNFNATSAPTVTPIPPRRWITGFELLEPNEGGFTTPGKNSCRDSSRTIDGFGMPFRGQNNSNTMTRRVAEYIAAFTPHTSWERFYLRARVYPTLGSMGIWRCDGNPLANPGMGLKISTSGALEIYAISNFLVQTLIATIPAAFPINEWTRIDLLLKYDSGVGTNGGMRTYLNGVLVNTHTNSSGNNMNETTFHLGSQLGKWDGPSDNVIELDFDDWICADVPNILGVESLDSVDWYIGSHVVQANCDSATLGTWAGSRGVLNQGIAPQKQSNSTLTNSTSGAVLEGLTDYSDDSLTVGVVAGVVAAVVGQTSSVNLGTDGQLGYKIAGGAAVLATVNQSSSPTATSVLYRPSSDLPGVIEPFSVVKSKSADANLDTTFSLQATVEQIGVWGPEDDPSFEEPVTRVGFLHNCHYAKSMWGYIPATPYSPVFAVGATYVGNGTYQEILLPGPCHFLFIRATTGAPTAPVIFHGGMIAPHMGGITRDANPQVRVWADINGVCKFSVNGTNINCNSNTIVYQYFAFCDPGMRFTLSGVYSHGSALSSFTNILLDDSFLAGMGFITSETMTGTPDGTDNSYVKGPGSTSNNGNLLQGGSQITNFGSFGVGTFTSQQGIHFGVEQIAYSLWRSTEENCPNVMAQIFSYTGNGAGARVIPLTPAAGRFPLFAMVIPTTAGGAVFRDPTHSGANSTTIGGMSTTVNGITAGGIDTITVASTLNTNGVVYNVFVIPGDTLGWNNGTYYPSDCVPPDGPYEDPEPLQGVNVLGNGGLTLGGVPSLTLLKDISGIYTLIPGKLNDTLIDRQTGQPSVDVEIPDPTFKTGYIGG
jgi:hypothetical protein